MDQNDKQRNSSVPLGTFTEEDEAGEPATLPYEAVAPRDEESLPGVRVDAQAKAPRQRVKTLMGVPAFESIAPAAPVRPAAISGKDSDAELLADDVHVDIDLDDPDSSEVTMVHEADVVALPDSPLQPSAAERTVDVLDQTQPFERPAPEVGLLHRILEAAPPPPVSVEATDEKPSALPLLIPNQYVEARTRERMVESAPEELMPEPRDTSSSSQSVSNPAQAASTSRAPGAVPTSLAPREVARAPQPRETERSSRAGMWMVAAAMLLAAGGWYLTGGSFRRATLTEAPAAQPSAATQPMAAKNEETSMQSSSSVPPSLQPPPEQPQGPTELPTVAVTGNPNGSATGNADGSAPQHMPNGTAGKLHGGKGLSASARSLRGKRAGAKPASVNEPAGDMPELPNRGVVVQRLESVRSSVQACASGRSGVADLDITIANNGTVMHVLVGGDFAGTTQGSCIARAVREARFPTFKQDRMRILYPYAI